MSTRKIAKLAAVETATAKPETTDVPLVNVWDVYGDQISPWLTAELAYELNGEARDGLSSAPWQATTWQWIFFRCLVDDAVEAGADGLLTFADVLEQHVNRIRAAADAKRAALAAA